MLPFRRNHKNLSVTLWSVVHTLLDPKQESFHSHLRDMNPDGTDFNLGGGCSVSASYVMYVILCACVWGGLKPHVCKCTPFDWALLNPL